MIDNKITLLIMTQKGYYVLNELIKFVDISFIHKVIIGRDSNIEDDNSQKIEELCKLNRINYSFDKSSPIETKYSISISWRWIVKTQSQLIVLHDSLLPKYRGFAPLVNSLINEEKYIGVTALFASDEYDKGEIISQERLEIRYPIKIDEAIERINPLYLKLVKEICKKIIKNVSIKSVKQVENEATYSLWRNDEDYRIDWFKDATYIKRFIDSVGYPYKGAITQIDNLILRVLDSEIFPDVKIENRDPGKIIFIKEGYPIIVCGNGLLLLKSIIDQNDNTTIIPFKKFRTRFK